VRLDGKRVLITGAASGIGRATALAAAEKGAQLVLTDLQAHALEESATLVRERGGTVLHAVPADVTDRAAVGALADQVHAEHGSVDVVMNVAGVSTWGSVKTLRPEDWDKMIDVNLRGPIHVISAFVPAMIDARRGGHVVNVSSAAGLIALPWHAAYSASKFGLRGVSEVLRFDLRRHRIGVSLVCPGGVDTPLVKSVDIVGVDRERPEMKRLIAGFRRHAKSPEHVAACLLRGVERERYMVYTSFDIRLAYWAQRVFPPGYNLAMRLMNDVFVRATKQARV